MTLEALFELMVKNNASDLFITSGAAPSLKINGTISPVSMNILDAGQARDIIYSIMNTAQREEFEHTHESNFAVHLPEIGRFRVNVFQQQYQMGMVVRKIETIIPTINELNLPPILEELAMKERGLVIFVGTTGSGKSSSLASMVGYRNRNSSNHIVCVEDPIEYVHKPEGCIITQREVGVDTDSFESALKNSLRQAPDVILIGEIRSRETMELAMAFAETGHLCLSTMHATNAYQALERILHLFGKDSRDHVLMDLSLNLGAIVAQRLIPKKDDEGRWPGVEILLNTPFVSDLILRGDIHLLKDAMKNATKQGMKTFDQAVYDLYEAGKISYDDAILYADSPNEVRLMIKLGGKMSAESLAAGFDGMKLVDPD